MLADTIAECEALPLTRKLALVMIPASCPAIAASFTSGHRPRSSAVMMTELDFTGV
jgi:hypothetical protein